MTLGKEPCEDCVNEAAEDHDRDANGNYERHAISTDRRDFVVSPQLLLLFLERGLVPNI